MKIFVLTFLAFLILGIIKIASDAHGELNKNQTEIVIINDSGKDVVVYLTLGEGKGYIDNVKFAFGIKNKGLQGYFILRSGDTISHRFKKAVMGNLSFENPPLNCPNGNTLFEFCLNNKNISDNAQETVDISCVSGVTALIEVNLVGGGKWNAGVCSSDVREFTNDSIVASLYGVFPLGCTNCVNSNGKPKCVPDSLVKCAQFNCCNVQRLSKTSGGKVVVKYKGRI
jgi:hypothetical protein